MIHIKIILLKWLQNHQTYKKKLVSGFVVVLTIPIALLTFSVLGGSFFLKAAPTDDMKTKALWIRDTYYSGMPFAIVYPTGQLPHLYILHPSPTTGGNSTAITNRDIGTWPMNLNTQGGNHLIISEIATYLETNNLGCSNQYFVWKSASSKWENTCISSQYLDSHIGNTTGPSGTSGQILTNTDTIANQIWSNVGFYFNNSSAITFASELDLTSSGPGTVGGTATNPGEFLGGTLYVPAPPEQIPLVQNNYRLQYTTPGNLEWRIDSAAPCKLNQTTVNMSGINYYPIVCNNNEYNLFAKVGGQWYFAAPPVSQSNSYGLVEFLPSTNTCSYITYSNYTLVFSNNSEKVCDGISNKIVDGILPPLDSPIIDIPTLDLGAIDLGQFEFMRPIFQWGVDVVNSVLQFFGDAANQFLTFGYNAIRSILIVIIPDPSAIDFFFSGTRSMVQAAFAGVQVFADFVVTPTSFSNVQATLFGKTFTIVDWSWFSASNISTSVKPVLDVSISIGIFLFSINAFTNIAGKRKLTE